MKKKVVLIFAVLMVFLSGCSQEYDNTEKHIVNVTVLKTEKKPQWIGKCFTYNHNVYFDVGEGNEWKVNNHELFDSLKEGDEISVFKTDYLKDGEVIKSEFEFIN